MRRLAAVVALGFLPASACGSGDDAGASTDEACTAVHALIDEFVQAIPEDETGPLPRVDGEGLDAMAERMDLQRSRRAADRARSEAQFRVVEAMAIAAEDSPECFEPATRVDIESTYRQWTAAGWGS